MEELQYSSNFTAALMKCLTDSVVANHYDNCEKFEDNVIGMASIREAVEGGFEVNRINLDQLNIWAPLFRRLDWFYDQLDDSASRDLLVRLVAYRLMGYHAVKLQTDTPQYRKLVEAWASRGRPTNLKTDINGMLFALSEFDLNPEGYDMCVLSDEYGIVNEYVLNCYRCPGIGVVPEPGDVVIDGGACFGDTALHFAHDVGEKGKVFAFEFVPENMEVLSQALSNNPDMASRIELVPHPLWENTGTKMTFMANGPGSRLTGQKTGRSDLLSVTTYSIDDIVKEKNIEHVNFIKMDIEGSETKALAGATETIKRFRPKLAICLYHRPSDFVEVPSIIKGLVPGYRFRIGHYSINQWETVLFAAT